MHKKQIHNLKRAKHNKHIKKMVLERKISYKKNPEAFIERVKLKEEKSLSDKLHTGIIESSIVEQPEIPVIES